MLNVEGIETAYGAAQVLFGVEFSVNEGEIFALVGRNGMGKTTTIRSIMGLSPPRAGRIVFRGRDCIGLKPHAIARLGIALVPEGRQIFPNLSVEENLIATERPGPEGRRHWTLERTYNFFPQLEERRRHMGDQLSGGEQQMLAIGRALMTNPHLTIFDEATEGLAPVIRSEIWRSISDLKQSGEAVLIIDSDIEEISRYADRCAIIEKGRIVWRGTGADLKSDRAALGRYLSLG